MPRAAVSQKYIQSELARCLEDNDFRGFEDALESAVEIGYNLDEQYGKEVGYKTILHLALDEDDHDTTRYIQALLNSGASARHFNTHLYSAPLHVAAEDVNLDNVKMLLQDKQNKGDVNALNKLGLTPIHILLAKLMEFAVWQNKAANSRPNKMTDDEVDKNILNVFGSLILICDQRELRFDFDHPPPLPLSAERMPFSYKKLASMTPLQILCSFQTWNAAPINIKQHKALAEVVDSILNRGADPNSVAAKNTVAGSVAGSTPPVFLAATRGYHLVVEVFKRFNDTNFLIENKFGQTILHMVLKAGYNNKIVVHGETSGRNNEQTVFVLLSDTSAYVKTAMRSVINRIDSSGNSALHYAKHYPNQEVVKLMLRNGAKIHKNEQEVINVHPKTLDDYLFKECMKASGDDVDDEDFFIKIKYDLFARPEIEPDRKMEEVRSRAQAWTIELEKEMQDKKDNEALRSKKGRVDTKRLEYFADVDQYRFLLKHPVLASFLELELNDLKFGYRVQFLLYLLYVVVIFKYFSERFTSIKDHFGYSLKVVVYKVPDLNYELTLAGILTMALTLFFVLRELWQLCRLKRRYFHYFENVVEWCVIGMVIFSLIPNHFMTFGTGDEGVLVQKHLAAGTFLLAFMQLYLCLVRIVPNTPIPLYINMFTTVLKTYFFILLSYVPFLIAFSFVFSLIFNVESSDDGSGTVNSTNTTTSSGDEEFDHFGTIFSSLVRTTVMLTGEFNYPDIPMKHWLGRLIFVIFLFLMVIVIMNLLNGLAVSDIQKIKKDTDTYHHISIVETLSYSRYVPMLAQEIKILPNTKPESQKLLGFSMPGAKNYVIENESKKKFYLNENIVKAARDLVVNRQSQNYEKNSQATLETVGDDVDDIKKDQSAIQSRVANMEEKLDLILDIMQSRYRPPVDRA